MFGPPGTAYVYFTYGMHHCFNVVCGAEDEPVAVLVRALAPTEGLERMSERRGRSCPTELCSGPAKLCQALGVDRGLSGVDMIASPALFLERLRRRPKPAAQLVNTPRVGVAYAGAWAHKPLRWRLQGSPHASPDPC